TSAHTLRRRLKDAGLLVTTDATRGKLTVRKTLQGRRREVLHVAWPDTAPPPETGPTGPDGEAGDGDGPALGAGRRAVGGQARHEPAHESAGKHGADGPAGRTGPSDAGEEAAAGNLANGRQPADWGDWQ